MLLHGAVLLRLLFMRGQTLTKSKLLLLTISHLTQNIPTVLGHKVFLVAAIRPVISLHRVLFVPVPEAKVSIAVGMLAAIGAASGSAAGHKVSNRVREVFKLNRGGELLHEVVQAG